MRPVGCVYCECSVPIQQNVSRYEQPISRASLSAEATFLKPGKISIDHLVGHVLQDILCLN